MTIVKMTLKRFLTDPYRIDKKKKKEDIKQNATSVTFL